MVTSTTTTGWGVWGGWRGTLYGVGCMGRVEGYIARGGVYGEGGGGEFIDMDSGGTLHWAIGVDNERVGQRFITCGNTM